MPKAPPLLLASLALVACLAPPARAADEAALMADAARILNQMSADPNSGVPLELLRRSEGVIVVPNMLPTPASSSGRSSAGACSFSSATARDAGATR